MLAQNKVSHFSRFPIFTCFFFIRERQLNLKTEKGNIPKYMPLLIQNEIT